MKNLSCEDYMARLLHQLTLVIRHASWNNSGFLKKDRDQIIFNANELIHDIANFYLGHFDKSKVESRFENFQKELQEIEKRYRGPCKLSYHLGESLTPSKTSTGLCF